ncbi:MAG: ribose-phosphate pyrophosphokinase [Elusimicrobiales bacterium]
MELRRIGSLKLFSGNANLPLAADIAKALKTRLGEIRVERFADGETNVQILENVRGCDCYVIEPSCPPVNHNTMELLIMIDALKRASAGRINAVIPYYGYGRADRKTCPRVPITAKLVADLLTVAGAHRVMAIDLHAGQIQGFFDIPVDHLQAAPAFVEYFRKQNYKNPVVVSPDVGGVERARQTAKKLNAGLVIIDKRRPRPNEAHVYNVIGDVSDTTAIIVDDIVDTAGTLVAVANAVKKCGAARVIAACTHGVLSANAVEKINRSVIELMLITDTLPPRVNGSRKIKVLSAAKILAEAIQRNHNGLSISELFD